MFVREKERERERERERKRERETERLGETTTSLYWYQDSNTMILFSIANTITGKYL